MTRRIYLAGPMSGIRDFNFPEFHKWAEHLRALGYDVVNPADKETLSGTWMPDFSKIPKEWGCPTGQGTNEGLTPGDVKYRDVEELMTCGGIALLPGWENSLGARFELLAAKELQLETYQCLENDHGMVMVSLPPTEIETRARHPE